MNVEGMQEWQAWITMMGNFGFPVVISLYLLTRLEKKLETLDATIQNLFQSIRNRNRH
jgi:hypothetical protein